MTVATGTRPLQANRRRPETITPPASSDAARRRMKSTRRSGTREEAALCSAIRVLGIHFMVQGRITNSRRTIDVVIRRPKVAIFVDGCFWHGCPRHATWPRANASWWRAKIQRNAARDRSSDRLLRSAGWGVIRIWTHERPEAAAARILNYLRQRRRKTRP